MDWIYLAQNWDQKEVCVTIKMNLQIPRVAKNFMVRCGSVSFSRSKLLCRVIVFVR